MTPFWTASLFWIAAVACVAVALAFVLPALMRARSEVGKTARRDVNIAVYRDQLKELDADRANGLLAGAQYQCARRELEARLADDALAPEDALGAGQAGASRRLGYTLAAVLPAAAFGLYFWLGNPTALEARAPDAALAGAEQDFMQLIRRAEEKARTHPDDGQVWTLLARSYGFMERWPDALKAYEKAIALLPQDASVLSGYAEALAIANHGVLAGKPMELVRQALTIDPVDTKSLELAGINAFREGDFAQASIYYKRVYSMLPPGSAYAEQILAVQQEAGRLAKPGVASLERSPRADSKTTSVALDAIIQGSVDIAPALKSRLEQTDVLFLFARSNQGGPPVAAIRASAGKFPQEFRLDDSAMMASGNSLSQHKQVILVARLSKSGNPIAQPGDLEGRVADVAVGSKAVKLVIDQVLP